MNEDVLANKNLFGNVSLYSLDSILGLSHGIDQHGINLSTAHTYPAIQLI